MMLRMMGTVFLLLFAAQTAVADPRDEVIAAFDAVVAAGKYRVEVTTLTGKREHVMQLDVEFPNRFHMRSPDSEMILLPGGTWMRMGQEWMRMPVDMSKSVESYTQRALQEGRSSIEDVALLSEAVVAGCDARVYTYRQTGKFMGRESEGTVEMAVCKASGLPSQIITRTGTARKPTVVTSIYDFAADIRIQSP
jgi:hypothetical protein